MSKKGNRHRWRRYKRGFLYREQGGRCYYCGNLLEYEHCTLDHVIPRARGGLTEISNLVIACVTCNQAKGDRWPDDPVVLALYPSKKPGRGSL